MAGFGKYAKSGGNARPMRTAIYRLAIISANVKLDGRGEPVVDPKTDKVKFAARFEVVEGDFKGEKITRTMNVTYDPSSEGKYGPFACFIECATGIPCGDKRQEDIGESDLVGTIIPAFVKHADGYNNVDSFVSDGAVEKAPARAAEPRREAPAAQHTARPAAAPPAAQEPRATPADPEIVVARMLNAIPSARAQQIRALAKWANLEPAQLATKIAFFSGGEPLAIGDVAPLIDKIKAERAA